MKLVWLIASAILITACEATPPPIEFTFEKFEAIEATVTYPEELPKLQELECYPGEGDACKIAGYSTEAALDTFAAYKIRATSNTTIAQNNGEALQTVLEQNEELIGAGKAAENIYKIREEQLQYERRQREIEKWYYRGLIAIVTGAAIYAGSN